VSGAALHLWHGDIANRRYFTHNLTLKQIGFDPAVDIELDGEGSWRFKSDRTDLAEWAAELFTSRREDG
jgi:hypothetical protein